MTDRVAVTGRQWDGRPVGVDASARQLAVARRLQGEFGSRFPLVQADVERVPLTDGCADLVIEGWVARRG